MNSNQTWQHFGITDPYFGVLTDDRFRGKELDPVLRAEFLRTGEDHVNHVFSTIISKIDPSFAPSSALDFGCGVGRIVVPLARRCQRVVGVDISQAMLDEAAENSSREGVVGVELVVSDDELRSVDGSFDLVHTVIVMQHIPTNRGYVLIDAMLNRINPGGVGAIHLTFDNQLNRFAQLTYRARVRVPVIRGAVNLVKGRPYGTPMMDMCRYDLGLVLSKLHQTLGANVIHLEMTNHGGFLGAMIYVKRPDGSDEVTDNS